ncbi:MAG: helicase HerA-like domain-containing protein [Thermomicrobiales bacterium]
MVEPLLIAKSGAENVDLLPGMSNRHGVVCGATGTGKTVTIQAMCERFSEIGTPVFVADVKGDLAGLSQPGGGNEKVDQRLAEMAIPDYTPRGYPVVFWDIYGVQGHQVRTTVSEMGPVLLARLMQLNDTQAGVLQIVFAWADAQNYPLIDFKDLRALLGEVADNRKDILKDYGTVSVQSVGAIQRAVLTMEQQGVDKFFGEPGLDLSDFVKTDANGMGQVNVLAAATLYQSPIAYSTFLLWLLSELFESMPEVGDPDKPNLVFFFDEAHLLFEDTPKPLRDKIEQVVRLIRSKGVGVFFITQMPIDIPEVILGQLGNRVEHALRAYTPRDQKAIRAVAETFRTNPDLDVETAVTELQVGEALLSFLDDKGAPGVVQRALIIPPRSRVGAITDAERAAVMQASTYGLKYATAVDTMSAAEMIEAKHQQDEADAELAKKQAEIDELEAKRQAELEKESKKKTTTSHKRQQKSPFDDVIASASNQVGREIGRQLVRGLLGSIKRQTS